MIKKMKIWKTNWNIVKFWSMWNGNKIYFFVGIWKVSIIPYERWSYNFIEEIMYNFIEEIMYMKEKIFEKECVSIVC